LNLVGYSMGAVVALLAASEEARVRRLVAGGVGAGVVERGGVDTRVISNTALAAGLRADNPAAIEDPAVLGVRQFAEADGADRLALAAQAEATHAQSVPLDRIAAPALILAGDQDPLAVRPEVLTAALPHAQVQLLPGDHLSVISHPAFAQAILAFLEQ
jgi:pimeloyl-ACP methyl ester carboxylesterase